MGLELGDDHRLVPLSEPTSKGSACVRRSDVTLFHRYLGSVLVFAFFAIMIWGLVLRLMRRDETPNAMWAVQHWTENLLVVQTVLGIILLIIGRRATGGQGLVWLHYFYGSLFPLVAIVGGRLAALRRETREYVGLSWGAFFALALVLRAVQNACGDPLDNVVACLIP